MKIETKKATAIGVAGLLIGGFGGYGLLEPITVTETVLVNDTETLEALEGQIGELQIQLDTANSELDLYAEVIAEAIAEDIAEETAIEYLYEKDFKVQDWMNDFFSLNIEDDDDISFSNIEEIEVTNADYEEGDYDISFEVRVDYIEDDDEDLDGKEYIKVNVEIRDGEAEDISFEEI
jgi:hypothetical protein